MQEPHATNTFGKFFTIATWLIIVVLLFLFFDDTLNKKHNPNQHLQSVQGINGETRTVLMQNQQGHYVGRALINQKPVEFMLDTGATTVAITAQTAKKLGLTFGAPMQVSTANGLTQAYRSQIDTLALGDITLYNIPASIVPNLSGTEILLGMSALKQLEFHQQGKKLTLIQHN